MDEADHALRRLKQSANPLPPAYVSRPEKRTNEQADADRKAQAGALIAAGEKAKEFYEKYPDHSGAVEARKIEALSLLRAVRAGDLSQESKATQTAEAFVADKRHSRSDRYLIASMLKQQAVQKKNIKDKVLLFAEYERNAQELLSEYPDEPEIYRLFLGLARNAPDEGKARKFASDLLQSPASAEVKADAQALLDRLDMPGKKLDLRFIVSDGTIFDLAEQKGTPVVIYFWSSQGGASAAAIPSIRALAAEKTAKFIGVNLGPDSTAKSLNGESVPGPQAWSPHGLSGKIPQQLRVNRIPMVYVFDREGVVVGLGHPRELSNLLARANGNSSNP